MSLFILFETAAGLSLFEKSEGDEVALEKIQSSVTDSHKFKNLMKLKAFAPFTSAEAALDASNCISEGMVNDFLRVFLEQNVPKAKKKESKAPKVILGVQDQKLAGSIQEELGFSCESSTRIQELCRGIRMHFSKFVPALSAGDSEKAQLGLSHSYSRAKVKFNVNKIDNMVIQGIALLDVLDKDLNTFSMRVKEWYGWHFPELVKIVSDNYTFAQLVIRLQNKTGVSEDMFEDIEAIVNDDMTAREIIEAAKASMGTDISDIDMVRL